MTPFNGVYCGFMDSKVYGKHVSNFRFLAGMLWPFLNIGLEMCSEHLLEPHSGLYMIESWWCILCLHIFASFCKFHHFESRIFVSALWSLQFARSWAGINGQNRAGPGFPYKRSGWECNEGSSFGAGGTGWTCDDLLNICQDSGLVKVMDRKLGKLRSTASTYWPDMARRLNM